MPNRIIKESICVSEQIDELGWFEEVFFYRLLVNCDDYGCMDAREKVLSAKLFPLKNVKASVIDEALDRLAKIGLIGLYEADGKPYLKVLKWSDHQRVRVSKHKYPEPDSRQLAASCGELRQLAANGGNLRPESNPIQSESNPYPNPKTNPNPNPTRTGAGDSDDQLAFDLFWKNYPNKVAKQDALKAWKKLKPDAETIGRIMAGLNRWIASDEWNRDNGRFIPHPATWINGKRWEDEVKPPAPAPAQKKIVAQDYEQRDYSPVRNDFMAEQERRVLEHMRRKEHGL